MNINEHVVEIISDPTFNNFFPYEMKKALEEKNGKGYLEYKVMVKFVSAQIKLLLKEGVIEKVRQGDLFIGYYVKTQVPIAHKKNLIETAICIKEKYISYKQQLLLGIGEADEYKQLCKEYPELKEDLQPKYNNTRDQNTKILGKIKAIESLLNNKST
jgi:hypothetical protein